ncbi:hypothetical protein NMY22_g13207 [Coprinellus aureogranulatus]|nr:hypothetical protein NMY22_g13207 [Coprinellus aureogranulatus]
MCALVESPFPPHLHHRLQAFTLPPYMLPAGIIDNIIEKIAEGERRSWLRTLLSCSVASRSFVEPSQQRIFRDVTLVSPPVSRISRSNLVVHPQTYTMFNRTLRFVDVITSNPRLRDFVEHLTYELTSIPQYSSGKDRRDRDYILGSFRLLPNVKAFALGVSNPEEDSSLAIGLSDEFTERAVLAMIRRPQVASFSLRCISDFDIIFLHEAMSTVKSLSLRKCAIEGIWSEDEQDVDRTLALHRAKSRLLFEEPLLQHLACDGDSLQRCINIYLGLHGERRGVASTLNSLSFLQTLDLILPEECDEEIYRPLLHCTANFTRLTVTRASKRILSIWDSNASVLDSISPSSLDSVTDIAFNTILNLEDETNFSGSDSSGSVDDLLSSQTQDDVTSALALGDKLARFRALRSLHLMLVIQGDLPIDAERDRFLGRHWTRLSNTLANLCTALGLRRTSILIHVRALDYFAVESHLEDAHKLHRGIVENVYPAQFLEMERLHMEGLVTFVFTVEVSVGNSIEECTGLRDAFE